jgi:hypothetical protein
MTMRRTTTACETLLDANSDRHIGSPREEGRKGEERGGKESKNVVKLPYVVFRQCN